MSSIALNSSGIFLSLSPSPNRTSINPTDCFSDDFGDINGLMKMHVINLAERGLCKVGKRLYGAKIAIMSLSYKKNINDTRESSTIKIIEELVNLGAEVRVYDPYVSSLVTEAGEFASVMSIEEALSGVECVIFLADHDIFKGSLRRQ